MNFHFWVMEKSWKFNVEKEGAPCADVRQCYMQNGLQFNPDKSEALVVGTSHQLRAVASVVSTVSGASVDLPVADDMKVLEESLGRWAPFLRQARVSCRAIVQLPCPQAIRHIRHLLTTELARTLACSLVLSRFKTRLQQRSAPRRSHPRNIDKLQGVQNSAARVVLHAPRRSHTKPLLHLLHRLPVKHRSSYKLAC